MDKSLARFSYKPNIGITSGDVAVQIDLSVEILAMEFLP